MKYFLIAFVSITAASVINDWFPIISDQLLVWKKNGINKQLIDKTFSHHGSNIIYQYIDNKLYVYDPSKYCLCNNSVYGDRSIFTAHLRVCQALEGIIRETVKKYKLHNFEFVWSLDDIPMWNIAEFENIKDDSFRKSGVFYPGFGAIRCWSKGGLALPFLGSHRKWDINTFEKSLPTKSIPLHYRKGVAVFRGGEKGCSFERNTILNFKYGVDFSWTRRDCGRFKLAEVAKTSKFINYTFSFMDIHLQEHLFKYMLAVEGFGGWADRLLEMMFLSTVPFIQNHPCDQWFEPMMNPFVHYIPIAHDFRDLEGSVVWANSHPNQIETILKGANNFANKYLRKNGIIDYMYVMLNEYSKLLNYNVSLRDGSIISDRIYNLEYRTSICKN